VSFFPQLVAGPIERATNLLPQFFAKRKFDYDKGVDGLRQILWGLFKKIVIADSCAVYVDIIFSKNSSFSGSTLLLGAFLFAFQIYGDFSGYSDIAIGTARLFGFKLMRNFAFPYFSRDIAEFWRRWHISLTTWFRDYLYIPLGGSRGTTLITVRNIFIIFIVSGFWHGANWTFIVWGALNAFYFLPLLLSNRNRSNMDVVAQGRILPSVKDFFNIALTFSLTTFGWIFFRAEDLGHAFSYISRIFKRSIFSYPESGSKPLILIVVLFAFVEWFGRDNEYAIEKFGLNWKRPIRWFFYYVLVIIVLFNFGRTQEFIYFQF
jgi:D-alanyl-lipoteichoic acid acyltransferase DltB (MBOAT superfamily)